MSVSAGIDGPFPNEVASASSERATRLFTHASLFSALILQKFGIVSGSSYMAFCLPVYLVSLALMIFFGFCRIRLSCMILFGLMILTSLISTLVALSADSFSIQLSITSYLLFLILYCLFMFEPTYKFRCDIARKIFLKYALFISVVGILQYVLQFGHFQFRSFSVLFPFLKPILLEDFFNSNAIVQYGSDVTRANGVFLKEPSTFSQLIVIAATVEFMSTRRLHNLAVYGVAYLITLSGTGFISLTAALLIYAILSPKLAISLPVIGIAFLCAYFLVGLVVPDIVQTMEGRIYEFASPGSSAYARYIAQFPSWSRFSDDWRFFVGYGPGSYFQLSAALTNSAATNPALKFALEYGVPTVMLIFTYVIRATWLPNAGFVSILVLCVYQLGGGTELSADFIILASIVTIWGRDYPTRPADRRAQPAV